MKTDDQVLTQWIDDRIEFKIGMRDFFSRDEFIVLVSYLTNKHFHPSEFLGEGIHLSATEFKSIRDLLLYIGDRGAVSWREITYEKINDLLGEPQFKHLCNPRVLARFESQYELRSYLTKRAVLA